eukprot:CAMPEP_0172852296 /NCGR_PEP_ID=MMETSP1075-20121228/53080_1 /TAXON_ID=2916 /ORGANISM="Ceratium fusus, Strain PA161109" /LENGTH=37 /DNA_ID= /DNA_START= /DNA_END= /DNA_ORIENTATION=
MAAQRPSEVQEVTAGEVQPIPTEDPVAEALNTPPPLR